MAIRQPREEAELKGAHKKNPQRYRNEPPKSELPLGSAPGHLSKAAQACWFEISSYAIPGVFTGADRFMLELASVYLARFRNDPDEMPDTHAKTLIGMLSHFGMSPSARAKLGVEKAKEDNPFANLDS